MWGEIVYCQRMDVNLVPDSVSVVMTGITAAHKQLNSPEPLNHVKGLYPLRGTRSEESL